MKTLNCVRLLLLLLLPLGLASCGDKYYTDDFLRNSDGKLCGYSWMHEYETPNGELCKQYLEFDTRKTGKHTLKYFRYSSNKWEDIPYRTESFNYNWSWINNMEGLHLNFGGGDQRFFDNVWVRDYYLSGVFDGEELAFRRTDSPD